MDLYLFFTTGIISIFVRPQTKQMHRESVHFAVVTP